MGNLEWGSNLWIIQTTLQSHVDCSEITNHRSTSWVKFRNFFYVHKFMSINSWEDKFLTTQYQAIKEDVERKPTNNKYIKVIRDANFIFWFWTHFILMFQFVSSFFPGFCRTCVGESFLRKLQASITSFLMIRTRTWVSEGKKLQTPATLVKKETPAQVLQNIGKHQSKSEHLCEMGEIHFTFYDSLIFMIISYHYISNFALIIGVKIG